MKSTAMRKLLLFSAVLSLFLLVPASIIWAQVTKTLKGTVSYRSGMSETKFTTPNGTVVIHLPQSLTGSVITGTVSTEPAGRSEKEKSRNLKELVKMLVNLDGQKIPVTASPTNFDWLTHLDRHQRTPVELINVSGMKVAELSLPAVLAAPASGVSQPDWYPYLSTPSKWLVKGDMLNVYTDGEFKPGEKFVLTDCKRQQFTVKPVCLSANQAVISVPPEAVPGEMTVIEERWDQPVSKFKVNKAHVIMLDILLTSPNTNLRPGQKSFVQASIVWDNRFTGEFDYYNIDSRITERDTAEAMQIPVMSIDLRNLHPHTVTMEGGDLQRVHVNQFRQKLMEGEAARIEFQLSRTITGVRPGSFSVSATLHEDYTSSNDPFRPQLNVLNTPEDFNKWAKALKKDLGEYGKLQVIAPGGYALRTNCQRTIDHFPVCTNPDQLDECKAVAYSLLKPLNVPKGAANTWSSSYEAFRSALKPLNDPSAGQTYLPDWNVIHKGLDHIERSAYKNKDASLQESIMNTRMQIQEMLNQGPSAGNDGKLTRELNAIQSRADQSPVADNWKMAEMLFSTYCINKITRDGIDPMKSMVGYLDPVRKILMASPEYQQKILNSLQAVPTGNANYHIKTVSETMKPVSYDIRLMPFERTNTFDSEWWAEHLIETIIKKDTSRGEITSTSKDSTGTYYVYYKNAKCVVKSQSEDGTPGPCTEETVWDAAEQKSKPTGRYQRITCYKGGSCKKGNDFCTEAYLVSCITQIFMDAGCTKPLKTFDFKHFSCL